MFVVLTKVRPQAFFPEKLTFLVRSASFQTSSKKITKFENWVLGHAWGGEKTFKISYIYKCKFLGLGLELKKSISQVASVHIFPQS